MAHFAESKLKTDPTGFTTDEHLVVERVIVVANDIETSDGILGENDMHIDGENWCIDFFKGGTWKQTSYNHKFRKQYAGSGYRYDSSKDKFICPQPYASWSLNDNDDWEAPVTYPTEKEDKSVIWEEENLRWIATDTDNNNFYWDSSALAWVST